MKSKTIHPTLEAQLKLLAYCVEQIMPLEKLGFNASKKFFAKYHPGPLSLQSKSYIPTVIYDSEKCRIKFQVGTSGYGYSFGTYGYYGRLHAKDDLPVMKWKKEDCHCWHTTYYLIPFLEGISAIRFVETGYLSLPELGDYPVSENLDTARVQELVNKCGFPDPTTKYILSGITLHAAVWNRYGDVLFDLFNRKNNELWSKYAQYLKEIYDIRGRDTFNPPEFDKVC